MNSYQSTILTPVSFSGVGLHTGLKTTISLRPSGEYTGIAFQRMDLPDRPVIPATVEWVHNTSRGTSLANGHAKIHTIEHLMAALAGLGIDNLLIEVDGPEIPILDGSAQTFVEKIQTAGYTKQPAPRDYIVIRKKLDLTASEGHSSIQLVPHDGFAVQVEIDYNSSVIGRQSFELKGLDSFKNEIAPSRTFCFVHELEHLYQANLIRGGNLNNAVIFAERDISHDETQFLADLMGKETVRPQKAGVLHDTPLRFENEPARHKLLDLIGDLFLLGRPLLGKIIAKKPGHTSNIDFVRQIKKHLMEEISEYR